MSDRNLFNQVVYTPLSDALRLLDERQKDPVLMAKVEELLKGDIPEILKNKVKYAVQFRQIATPNYEGQHFIKIAKENNLSPIFFEYLDDKFTSNNDFKHSLGQIHVQNNLNKNGVYPVEKITIVDFAGHDGNRLKDVVTVWKEPLVDFHRRLFTVHGYNDKDLNFYDASIWLKNNGERATDYYINFFLLFSCFGIIFENFLLDGSEGDFTKEVVLSAIEKVVNLIGIKPLIVPVEPIDLENDMHWISYHPKIKTLIP